MAANGITCLQRALYGGVAFAWRSILPVAVLAIVAGRCATSGADEQNQPSRAGVRRAAQRPRPPRPAPANGRAVSIRRDRGNVARAAFDAQVDAGTEASPPGPEPRSTPKGRRAEVPDRSAPAPAQPLALPARDPSEDVIDGARARGAPSLLTALGGLLLVLALFLLVVWLLRRGIPQASSALPPGVFRVLGRAPLVDRQYVHLIHVGNKLLLVAASPSGVETLTEIVDPVEIDRLAGLCGETSTSSVTNAFRQVIDQFSQQRPAPSFVDQMDAAAHTDEPRVPRNQSPLHA